MKLWIKRNMTWDEILGSVLCLAGMGMLCKEEAFQGQFAGVKTERFSLNRSGTSSLENEIDTVSGASTSSQAVVNAVNAALDFFAANFQ